MMNKNNIRIISRAEAAEQISMPKWIDDNQKFLLHEGNALLSEHLQLDWEQLSTDNWSQWSNQPYEGKQQYPFGIIITGNLTVNGNILNTNGDGGPCLFVKGDCQAKNLVAGGAYIEIKGNTTIEGVVYAFYNHGELVICETLDVPIFIQDDHYVSVGKKKRGCIHLQKTPDRDAAIPAKLKKILSPRLQLWGDILTALCKGDSILAKPGETIETIEDWVNIVWGNPKTLKKVPKLLQTEEFYQALFAENSPLNATTVLEMIGFIPEEVLTEQVLIAALQLSPKCFLRLPMSFDLHQWYELCFLQVKNPKTIFDAIPAQYISSAMQAHYNKL